MKILKRSVAVVVAALLLLLRIAVILTFPFWLPVLLFVDKVWDLSERLHVRMWGKDE